MPAGKSELKDLFLNDYAISSPLGGIAMKKWNATLAIPDPRG
jgi:hypothetical protein